jgi:hypothetical protein
MKNSRLTSSRTAGTAGIYYPQAAVLQRHKQSGPEEPLKFGRLTPTGEASTAGDHVRSLTERRKRGRRAAILGFSIATRVQPSHPLLPSWGGRLKVP